MSHNYAFGTHSARAGINTSNDGSVAPPVHLTSTFAWHGIDQPRDYDYSRTANPTRTTFADALCELENGAGAVVTSSGMSAITTVLATLTSDDILLFPHDAYGGTWRLVNAWAAQNRFRVHTTDLTAPDITRTIATLKPTMIWVETPSNPLLRVTDLPAICASAKIVDALVCVDNTLMSPGWQKPLDLGADIVVHSATKYLAGHSDVVSGAIVTATETLCEDTAWWANCLGVTGSPFDSFLALRGVRTLSARITQHGHNATAVLAACQAHPAITAVHYPGLGDAEAARRVAAQQRHGGALITIELAGGLAAAKRFADHSKLFTLAVSLGGVESLLNHPATMTHAAMTPEAQTAAGITPGMLRLSVGIEDPADLVADITAAADAAATTTDHTTSTLNHVGA